MKIETDVGRHFTRSKPRAVGISCLTAAEFKSAKGGLTAEAKAWAQSSGFAARPGEICLVPGDGMKVARVLFGVDRYQGAMAVAKLARSLPQGSYFFEGPNQEKANLELAWAMGGYSFERYKKASSGYPKLVSSGARPSRRVAEGVFMARDLINIPANDMGPDALDRVFRKLAKQHGARVTVTKGDALLKQNFPMVHAVGRAAQQAPRVLDMKWGKPKDPKITLVGKGVTFDTGGLNIKPGSSMALMKKDMGGAANVLGLAHMIMDAKLAVRLRVIVGAVENSIAGNAFRPGDVLASRKGISVEIGNTDAEGRLVLGDCLALGDEDRPDVMIDMATLTGAARVALGPDLPPFYTDDEKFAAALTEAGTAVHDPLWRMPLWHPYDDLMRSKIADVNHINTAGIGFAGSITAALFLARFVEKTKSWTHFDIYGWVPSEKPWARVGGEAQGIRALYSIFDDRYG